jgi:hypothetical protein
MAGRHGLILPCCAEIHLPPLLSKPPPLAPSPGPCSAPDYPQFMPEGAERYNNLGAVAVLTAPDWATPAMRQFAAAHPRPSVSGRAWSRPVRLSAGRWLGMQVQSMPGWWVECGGL